MNLNEAVRREIGRLERTKTFKKETVIESEQGAVVRVAGKDAVMLASNNYLGLASDPRIKQAAIRGVRDYGYGVSSVRFLCGTLTVHRQLEEKIAGFLGTEDAVLFSSCFAANEGFFASIINEKMDAESYRDVIYSDVYVDIVQPELRLVIPDRLFALHAIGDVNVRKTVVIEIKRAAAPRPAGARDSVAHGGLFESAAGTSNVQPVAKGHRRTALAVLV